MLKLTENILKGRQESKEHNAYYLSTLFNYYLYGINFDDPANYEDIVNGLTVKDVKKVMQEFYDDPNIVDVVFVPKEEAAAEYLFQDPRANFRTARGSVRRCCR